MPKVTKKTEAPAPAASTNDPFADLLERPLAVMEPITGQIAVVPAAAKAKQKRKPRKPRPIKLLWKAHSKKPSRLLAHPDNWIKCRIANHVIDEKPAPDACKVCVGGALCVALNKSWKQMELSDEAAKIQHWAGKRGFSSFAVFNDAHTTRHKDVLKMLRECGL